MNIFSVFSMCSFSGTWEEYFKINFPKHASGNFFQNTYSVSVFVPKVHKKHLKGMCFEKNNSQKHIPSKCFQEFIFTHIF